VIVVTVSSPGRQGIKKPLRSPGSDPDTGRITFDPPWLAPLAAGDPDFLRFTGPTDLLAPEEVYKRDQKDWESDTWYR
jgi:hypothetical protein